MGCKSALRSVALGLFGLATFAAAPSAQEPAGPGAPWRGAGAQPCFGAEGGTFQCPSAAGVADLRAGFTAARDMSSHGNGYADVDVRNAVDEGRIDGPRFQVSGRGIAWGGAAPPAAAANPLMGARVHAEDDARAAVREHVERG